jgi:hypothetical protein
MTSPIQSTLSPTASRIPTYIPSTTVISPRSISTRSQLEASITTLQSKLYQMFFSSYVEGSKKKKKERLWLMRDIIDRRARASVRFKTKKPCNHSSFFFFTFIC